MPYRFSNRVFLLSFLVISLFSCKTSGPGIFGKKSPHDQYSDRLIHAGLRSTVLGDSWFLVAEKSIASPLTVSVPYKETGYFSADRPAAAGLRFSALRGQKLFITVERKPVTNFNLYIDLWKTEEGATKPKHVTSADTLTYSIQHEVTENTQFILRLQPELLSSGQYTISVTAGPSLAYPIKAAGKDHIKSFWGAERDGGARKHEGIDMFASRRTPVVAAANGRVTRVTETAIGGKVVWLRVRDKDFTLYYAHLDSQLVSDGQTVKMGDTLGLMGNTGNARTTSPHLHFGVYTFNGPVDPLPFIRPPGDGPENISATTNLLGKLARSSAASSKMFYRPVNNSDSSFTLQANTLMRIEAATSNWFKVSLPNGQLGFIKAPLIKELHEPLRNMTVQGSLLLLEKPDSTAAKKASISSGETVEILATYQDYYFIKTRHNTTGWITK